MSERAPPWVILGKAAVEAAERGQWQKARDLGIEAWEARLKAYAAAQGQQKAQADTDWDTPSSPWDNSNDPNNYVETNSWESGFVHEPF